jgi:hypothetical protein
MNERIRELAEQADAYALKTIGKKWIGWEEIAPGWVECRDGKFAELIVRECLAIAKNREDELESAGLLSESNAVGNVSYRISRQFGVKR